MVKHSKLHDKQEVTEFLKLAKFVTIFKQGERKRSQYTN